MQVEGEPLEAPRTLPWYPDALGWHMAFSRAQLRKLPILKQVHELIIRENDAGAITRQEAVSMIPPLLLDVQAHHRVSHFCQYGWRSSLEETPPCWCRRTPLAMGCQHLPWAWLCPAVLLGLQQYSACKMHILGK